MEINRQLSLVAAGVDTQTHNISHDQAPLQHITFSALASPSVDSSGQSLEWQLLPNCESRIALADSTEVSHSDMEHVSLATVEMSYSPPLSPPLPLPLFLSSSPRHQLKFVSVVQSVSLASVPAHTLPLEAFGPQYIEAESAPAQMKVSASTPVSRSLDSIVEMSHTRRGGGGGEQERRTWKRDVSHIAGGYRSLDVYAANYSINSKTSLLDAAIDVSPSNKDADHSCLFVENCEVDTESCSKELAKSVQDSPGAKSELVSPGISSLITLDTLRKKSLDDIWARSREEGRRRRAFKEGDAPQTRNVLERHNGGNAAIRGGGRGRGRGRGREGGGGNIGDDDAVDPKRATKERVNRHLQDRCGSLLSVLCVLMMYECWSLFSDCLIDLRLYASAYYVSPYLSLYLYLCLCLFLFLCLCLLLLSVYLHVFAWAAWKHS